MNINNLTLQYANEILANLKCIQQMDQSESQSRSQEILTTQKAIWESPADSDILTSVPAAALQLYSKAYFHNVV